MGERPQALCLWCGSLERHRLIYCSLSRELYTQRFDRPALVVDRDGALRALTDSVPSITTADLFREDVDVSLSLEEIPFPDASFDLVMANHVMDEVDNDLVALRECFRVLSDGGWFIAPVPSPLEVTRELDERRHDGKIRLAGRDYEQRYLDAGFVVKARFSSRDFGELADRYQLRVHEPGLAARDEQFTVYIKPRRGG